MLHDADGVNNFTVVSDAMIASNDWLHIAGIYNATTSEAKIFINAQEMGNSAVVGGKCFKLLSFSTFFFSHIILKHKC